LRILTVKISFLLGAWLTLVSSVATAGGSGFNGIPAEIAFWNSVSAVILVDRMEEFGF
jgi:hypothetical protein